MSGSTLFESSLCDSLCGLRWMTHPPAVQAFGCYCLRVSAAQMGEMDKLIHRMGSQQGCYGTYIKKLFVGRLVGSVG